jgi:hypothetical protein
MMILMVLAPTAQTVGAPAPQSCSALSLKAIEVARNLYRGIGEMAGLSEAGKEALARMVEQERLDLFCGSTPVESDLARQRLLSVLAQSTIDQAALAAARGAELDALARREEDEIDGLIATFKDLSAADRGKLAAWFINDLKRSWAKEEQARAGK